MNGDFGRKSQIFTPPLTGFPWNFVTQVESKNWSAAVPDGPKILMMHSFKKIRDGLADGRMDGEWIELVDQGGAVNIC